MFDVIGSAFAQGAAPASVGAGLGQFVPLILIFVIFYFLLIRPQRKQERDHKQMVDNLQRGDSVVTAGGILGRIHRVEDDVAVVELGEVEVTPRTFKPVRVKLRKMSITAVTAKAGLTDDNDDKKS